MRIEKPSLTPAPLEPFSYVSSREMDLSSDSSISSLGTSSTFSFRVFLEDFFGFMLNLFLWPIHGFKILSESMLLIIFLPILFPILLVSMVFEVFLAIFNLYTCGCFSKDFYGPKFSSYEPTSAEMDALRPYVSHVATESVHEEEQIKLLHLLNSYFDFAEKYSSHTRGIENHRFNILLKVEVNGKAQLFQFRPNGNRSALFTEYLTFLAQHATPSSTINHTFVGLDHSYFLGLLKMKVKTDVVKVQLGSQITRFFPFPSLGSFIPSFIYRMSLGKHTQEGDQRVTDFSLWPGFTRRFCTHMINKSLKSGDLSETQISPLDFESIIRL